MAKSLELIRANILTETYWIICILLTDQNQLEELPLKRCSRFGVKLYFCHNFDAVFKRTGTSGWVRISSILCTSTLLRVKPYFDFLTKLYFDQNCTSTCTSRPISSPNLTKGRSTEKVELMRTYYAYPTNTEVPTLKKRLVLIFRPQIVLTPYN